MGCSAVESSSGEGTVLAVELPLEAEQVTRSARGGEGMRGRGEEVEETKLRA